jgi:hypothetical protein
LVKLNLLPAYVLERHRVKKVALAVVALFVLEAAGVLVVFMAKSKRINELNADLTKKTAERKEVEALEAKATAKKNQIQPFEATVGFIAQLAGDPPHTAPGIVWADLLDQVFRFTYDRTQYSELTLANNGVGLQGQVDSPPAYIRYLLNLERCPLLTEIQPDVNLGPAPGAGPVSFSVNCSLSTPIETPGLSAAALSAGGGGGMGMGGEMGMGPGMGGMEGGSSAPPGMSGPGA